MQLYLLGSELSTAHSLISPLHVGIWIVSSEIQHSMHWSTRPYRSRRPFGQKPNAEVAEAIGGDGGVFLLRCFNVFWLIKTVWVHRLCRLYWHLSDSTGILIKFAGELSSFPEHEGLRKIITHQPSFNLISQNGISKKPWHTSKIFIFCPNNSSCCGVVSYIVWSFKLSLPNVILYAPSHWRLLSSIPITVTVSKFIPGEFLWVISITCPPDLAGITEKYSVGVQDLLIVFWIIAPDRKQSARPRCLISATFCLQRPPPVSTASCSPSSSSRFHWVAWWNRS